MGGSFLTDLSQSPERMRCGSWLPSFARTTIAASLSSDHLLTPAEVDFAMGWPHKLKQVPGSCELVERMGAARALHGLSFPQRRSLAGNAMMLPSCLACWLYVLSNCVRRDLLQPLRPALALATIEEDDDHELGS